MKLNLRVNAADTSAPEQVRTQVEEQLRVREWLEEDIFAVKLALEEALVNAQKHGSEYSPNMHVHVDVEFGDGHVDIAIEDEGPGFNAEDLPDPTDPANLERGCGRGTLLINGFMTTVQRNEKGNRIQMRKERTAAGTEASS